jgi:PAS domain S-box-containing protein
VAPIEKPVMTEFPPPANRPAEEAGPGASPTEADACPMNGAIGPSAPTELETIYANAPVGLAVLDRDLRFVRVNERFAAIKGAAVVAHLGRTVREMAPDLTPQAEAVMRRVVDTGEAVHDVSLFGETSAGPGPVRTWLEQYHPIRDKDGGIVGVSVVAQDVTDIQRAQAVLRGDDERLRRHFQRSPGFVCILDGPDHRFEFVNDTFARLFGERGLLGKTALEGFPELADRGMCELLDRVRRTGERYVARGVTCAFRTAPDAPPRELSLDFVCEPLRGDRDEVTGIFVEGQDATERTRAAEGLRASEDRFRIATNASLVPFTSLEAVRDERGEIVDFRWVSVNAAASAILKRPVDELVGHRLMTVLPPGGGTTSALFRAYVRVVETGQGHDLEIDYDAHGITGTFQNVCTKLFDGVAIWFMDITERKRAERTLVAQAEALQIADRRKDEFLATLAHELRNPLAPLRTCLKILEHETMSDHGRRAVAMGTRQVLQLARLVDDLLEVARITRGKISLRIERVLVQQVLYTVVEAVSATFEANGQRLVVDLPQDSVWIDADAIRLGQIVENLLSNASKYTGREGVVTLRARRLDDEVAIEVQDTGIGIAVENLTRVFEWFAQIDASIDRADGGLGIGLALVRQLATLHGGRVSAASDGPGRGSTFKVVLPSSQPRAAQDTPLRDAA